MRTNTLKPVSTHGGPRPRVRDDDNRGGARLGTGPKPTKFTLKLGDALAVWLHDADGNPVGPGALWTVTEITRTHLVVTADNGDTYKIRR